MTRRRSNIAGDPQHPANFGRLCSKGSALGETLSRSGRLLYPQVRGAFSSDARIGVLINPVVDPVSGQRELKHTPARVLPFPVSWHGFVLARDPIASPDVIWWTLARGDRHLRYEIAGRRMRGDWSLWARRLLNAKDDADWIEYSDPAASLFRAVLLADARIVACTFVSPRPNLPSRSWLSGLFARDRIGDDDRSGLLMGKTAESRAGKKGGAARAPPQIAGQLL